MKFVSLSGTIGYFDLELDLELGLVGGLSFDWTGGHFVAVGGAGPLTAKLYRFPTCQRLWEISISAPYSTEPWLSLPDTLYHWSDNVAFAGNGEAVYIPGPTGEIVSVGVRDGSVKATFRQHGRYITSLDVSQADSLVATASIDGSVVLWEFDSPSTRAKPQGRVLSDKFSTFCERYSSATMDNVRYHSGDRALEER